ncbi:MULTISPECIES: ParB N-terminal domain-containing protein [unclassified Anabaena]|uniref:ParB N-terminal domain-containing protein n=1 Tax=unclassified Anabaena TaxID=2619674 RepID=UPI0039C60CA4
MKLSTSLVAVKKISCTKPRSLFSDDELEKAAQSILESEGVINPIVIRRTSLKSYELVDGAFEFYAAARAREIDPRKGEMISVFIIEPENEEVLTKQVELFRKSKSLISSSASTNSDSQQTLSTNIDLRVTNNESRMTNIESRFDNYTQELQTDFRNEIKKINDRLNAIETMIPKPMEPLVALNNLKLHELVSRLKRVNVKTQIIEKIVNEREANGNFTSFSNVVERIKGLGDKTMLKIIDSFSEAAM